MTLDQLLVLIAVVTQASVADIMNAVQAAKEQGAWVPACGGKEVPFTTRTGRRLLYVYQPATGNHGYLDLGTDLILNQQEIDAALGF